MSLRNKAIGQAIRFLDKVITLLWKNAKPSIELVPPFDSVEFSGFALQKLVRDYDFSRVLDVGSGSGEHARILMDHGANVTKLDWGESMYFKKNDERSSTIIGDFNVYPFSERYDCVWCSHVLEHQPNAQIFLCKVHSILEEGGVLAITVPPLKHQIVGGHVSLWNAGLLLYNLVLAGFDCSNASVLQYGYNVSVVLKKFSIPEPPALVFDSGDIKTIAPYLPSEIDFSALHNDLAFDGRIIELNWQSK